MELALGNCSLIAEALLTAGAKRFIFCPQHSDRFQGLPSSLYKRYSTLSPEVNQNGCESMVEL
jgi:hypothetical protein